MKEQRRRDWPIVVAVVMALLLVPLVLYVGGYFGLATTERGTWVADNTPVVWRTYDTQWLAVLFLPAARLEERLMGYEVEIGIPTDDSP